jgi:uncharacterized membrane protein YkvA (DUF1232 family)
VNGAARFPQQDLMERGLQLRSLAATQHAAGVYSDSKFFAVLRRAVQAAGTLVLRPALELYFIMKSPQTPAWAKITALGALGYLILPIDLIPDALPGIGWTDDIAVMLSALRMLRQHNSPAIQEQAQASAQRFVAFVVRSAYRSQTARADDSRSQTPSCQS